jgi:hypothetical protein
VESDVQADALIHDYLGRLQAASWPLPAGRRTELSGEVAEHIEAALAAAGRHDEVTVRNVLERLGPPEEIVAAEGAGTSDGVRPEHGGPGRAASLATAASPWGAVEIIAVLLLTVGAVILPFAGPLIGLGFAWASSQWTTREKGIATVIVLMMFVLVLLLFVLPVLGLLAARGD